MNVLEEQLLTRQLENFDINDEFWMNGHYYSDDERYKKYRLKMKKKVENEMKLSNCSEEEIVDNIIQNKLYRNHFAILSSKQKTHERSQYSIICDIVSKFNQKYNNKGIVFNCSINKETNQFLINNNGKLFRRTKKSDPYKESKLFDFDFTISYRGDIFHLFLINKYTKENGGSQNNALREMEVTHQYCVKNKNENIYFVFFLDGDFWKNEEYIISENNIIRTNHLSFEETINQFLIIKNII